MNTYNNAMPLHQERIGSYLYVTLSLQIKEIWMCLHWNHLCHPTDAGSTQVTVIVVHKAGG